MDDKFNSFVDLLQKADLLLWVFVFILIVIALLFCRFHRDPTRKFDLSDLLMDDGKASTVPFVLFGSFIVSSWVMIYLTKHAGMTPEYFLIYIVTWAVPTIAKLWGIKVTFPSQNINTPPQS
jgi:phosphoglycerol transferase MdoB-like AlkP superfamily enzyme